MHVYPLRSFSALSHYCWTKRQRTTRSFRRSTEAVSCKETSLMQTTKNLTVSLEMSRYEALSLHERPRLVSSAQQLDGLRKMRIYHIMH